jgi:hypothetical protein
MKKKIMITKKEHIPKKRGRPPKNKRDFDSKEKVYSMTNKDSDFTSHKHDNFVVQLNVGLIIINRIEKEISKNDGDKFCDEPHAFNDTVLSEQSKIKKKKEQKKEESISITIDSLLKNPRESNENKFIPKRDLLINRGVKKRVSKLMSCFNGEWPCHSPYDCWYDSHSFKGAPVGIPEKLINGIFYLYGNFCSYNCALRYLCPTDEDTKSQLMTNLDIFEYDDQSDKKQLLEYLCYLETDKELIEPIKKADKRLKLAKYGGKQSIEEFRADFFTHKEYHVFKSPLIPIDYRLEETIPLVKNRTHNFRLSKKERQITKTKLKEKISQSYFSFTPVN